MTTKKIPGFYSIAAVVENNLIEGNWKNKKSARRAIQRMCKEGAIPEEFVENRGIGKVPRYFIRKSYFEN